MPVGLDGNPHPLRTPARDAVLGAIVEEILRCRPRDRICIGVDGAAGSGKSTFGDEIARLLESAGRPTVRSTTDSFHNPRAIRYRRGRSSAEGYYRDSHDIEAICRLLIQPFRQGADVRVAAFDEPTDSPAEVVAQLPPPSAVLVFDGLFVHRPELRTHWAYSIYLEASERRERELAEVASRLPEAQFKAFVQRYVGGWQLYVEECRPAALASVIVDNNDLAAPVLARGASRAGPTG